MVSSGKTNTLTKDSVWRVNSVIYYTSITSGRRGRIMYLMYVMRELFETGNKSFVQGKS